MSLLYTPSNEICLATHPSFLSENMLFACHTQPLSQRIIFPESLGYQLGVGLRKGCSALYSVVSKVVRVVSNFFSSDFLIPAFAAATEAPTQYVDDPDLQELDEFIPGQIDCPESCTLHHVHAPRVTSKGTLTLSRSNVGSLFATQGISLHDTAVTNRIVSNTYVEASHSNIDGEVTAKEGVALSDTVCSKKITTSGFVTASDSTVDSITADESISLKNVTAKGRISSRSFVQADHSHVDAISAARSIELTSTTVEKAVITLRYLEAKDSTFNGPITAQDAVALGNCKIKDRTPLP